MTFVTRESAHPSQNNDADGADQLLTREISEALVKKIESYTTEIAECDTTIYVNSDWIGNVRWGRNTIITSGEVRNNLVEIVREKEYTRGSAAVSWLTDVNLKAAVRRAERLMRRGQEQRWLSREVIGAGLKKDLGLPMPNLYHPHTMKQHAVARAVAVGALNATAAKSGMLAAGYMEVSGRVVGRYSGHALNQHFPYTWAQCSVTVRDPDGHGSGWAGIDWNDWTRIDTQKIVSIALDKCLRSQNPVALEPGRYTVILEPQATSGLIAPMFDSGMLDRDQAETRGRGPFASRQPGITKIGMRIMDERLTIISDPNDPECGFPPFDGPIDYPALTWVERGVLKELSCSRGYAIKHLLRDQWIAVQGAYHVKVHGPTSTVEAMIENTKRGVLITRFWDVQITDEDSASLAGYTRDGVWLIENGKIAKAVKNFRFTESLMVALNNVIEVGHPTRVFRPFKPAVTPALKIREFNLSSLTDAI